MSKSIKFNDNTFLDASGITVDDNGNTLDTVLSEKIGRLYASVNNAASISINLNSLDKHAFPRLFRVEAGQWRNSQTRIVDGYVRYSVADEERAAVVLKVSDSSTVTATLDGDILTCSWTDKNFSYIRIIVYKE